MILSLLQFLTQIRVLHWQTKIYNHHVIFGDLYEKMDDLTDELIEIYFGQGNDKNLESDNVTLLNINSIDISLFLNDYIYCILEIKESNPDLTNICDTMIDTINRKKYLLELQ